MKALVLSLESAHVNYMEKIKDNDIGDKEMDLVMEEANAYLKEAKERVYHVLASHRFLVPCTNFLIFQILCVFASLIFLFSFFTALIPISSISSIV